ncbi:MAG: hypothetical protein JW862_16230 [Anaerolineales bacterium]|nr:hypothetical protein [Anaerolineales bacterium]
MKKVAFLLTLALLLTLASSAVAQSGLPGSGWWSGETIQNVGTSDATIQVTAYDMNSTATYTASQLVGPGEFYNFIPNSFAGMPSGFQGSAVVSANQPVKAIVNVTNRQSNELGIAGGKAAAQYQGIDGTMVDNTIYFPIAKGDSYGKTTTYYIQNAGTTAATATATFTMKNGNVHTYTSPTIQPNQMVLFSIFDSLTYDDSVANTGKVGAVMVSSAAPLAGVVMEHLTSENPATLAQSTRGFTSADFDTAAYAPIIKHDRFGRSTGIQVQNVSAIPINIQVTLVGFAGGCAGNTVVENATNVAPGAAAIFNQYPGQTSLAANCTASATIETTTVGGEIVALVSESYLTTAIPATGQSSVTSFAIPAGSATTTVSAPLFKDDRFEKRTGLQIQNVGAAAATNIVATFECQGAATFTAISLPQNAVAGGAVQFYTPSDDAGMFTGGNPFASGNVTCSVTVTADQPIVAIANESPIPASQGGTLAQDNNNYEGFNLAP